MAKSASKKKNRKRKPAFRGDAKQKAKKELATNRFPKKAKVNDDCDNDGDTNCRSPRVARKQEVETVYIDELDSDEDDYNEEDNDEDDEEDVEDDEQDSDNSDTD
jgi:ribonuclease E